MTWQGKIILAALGYVGLLGLTWLLWWIFGFTVFLVFLWIFASPLLLVLFIILLTFVLICIPIGYRVTAKTGAGEYAAQAKFSYLLGLVRGGYAYQKGGGKLDIYIAWFNLTKKREPKAEHKPGHGEEGSQTVAKLLSILEKVNEPEEPAPKEKSKLASKQEQKQTAKEGTSFKEKYRDFKTMKDKVLNYPNRKVITALVLGAVKKIIKTLKPKKIDISGIIGFADPSKTGMFIGIYESIVGMLKIRKHVRLGGNFDTEATVIDLNAYIKGRISIIRMILPIFGLWLKKPIRVLIKDLRRKGD